MQVIRLFHIYLYRHNYFSSADKFAQISPLLFFYLSQQQIYYDRICRNYKNTLKTNPRVQVQQYLFGRLSTTYATPTMYPPKTELELSSTGSSFSTIDPKERLTIQIGSSVINRALKDIKTQKAPSPSGISAEIFKIFRDLHYHLLSHIINQVIHRGSYHSQLLQR